MTSSLRFACAIVAAGLIVTAIPRPSSAQSAAMRAALAAARQRAGLTPAGALAVPVSAASGGGSAPAAAPAPARPTQAINAQALNLPRDLIMGTSRGLPAAGRVAAPRFTRDPAFDTFVDLQALGRAWDELDPAGVADGALALLEGERVLQRPHASLPAADVAAVAVRLAVEKGDAATLARLEKAAARSGDAKLGETVAAAKLLGGKTRAADPAATIDVGGVSQRQYAYCVAVSRAATRARVTGNAEYVLPLVDGADNVVLAADLPPAVRATLGERVVALCGTLPETPGVNSGALDTLAAATRRWGDDDDDERRREREEAAEERRRRREEEEERRRRREEERPAERPAEVTGGFG